MNTIRGAVGRLLGGRGAMALIATTLLAPVIAWAASGSNAEVDPRERVWDFESEATGASPGAFAQEVGTWEVVSDGDGHCLAQTAESERRAYNLALIDGTSYQHLDITVRVKANTGEVDQGGGMVWRAVDKDNYYVARYNPLEDNFRVYKVEGGKRTQMDHADAKGDQEWHTIRITMSGREIVGYLDGEKLLVAEDSTFKEAGRIGLWTKADARTCFDVLSVRETEAPPPPPAR